MENAVFIESVFEMERPLSFPGLSTGCSSRSKDYINNTKTQSEQCALGQKLRTQYHFIALNLPAKIMADFNMLSNRGLAQEHGRRVLHDGIAYDGPSAAPYCKGVVAKRVTLPLTSLFH